MKTYKVGDKISVDLSNYDWAYATITEIDGEDDDLMLTVKIEDFNIYPNEINEEDL